MIFPDFWKIFEKKNKFSKKSKFRSQKKIFFGLDIENPFPTSFYTTFGLTKTLKTSVIASLPLPGPNCPKSLNFRKSGNGIRLFDSG